MKDFDAWNEVKKITNENIRYFSLFFKEREIWWMYFGLNMGGELAGKGSEYVRPVLIIKKFNKNLFWGCAISSKLKPNNDYYFQIFTKDGPRSVILSQLRLYDLQRLRNKMDVCTLGDFCKIKQAIKDML